MIEMFQGLLACIAAALFFVTMAVAIKSVIWRSAPSLSNDDDIGAPEGDQVHFLIVEDPDSRPEKPVRLSKLRGR